MNQSKLLAACALLATTCGCMQYLVQPERPSIAGSPHTVQTKSYFGDAVQTPPFVLAKRCRGDEQLARVIVRRDFLQGAIAWLTLGLVSPATVIYECANASAPIVGDLDNGASPAGEE